MYEKLMSTLGKCLIAIVVVVSASSQEDKPKELNQPVKEVNADWYNATVDEVIDGDTIDATFHLGLNTERKERLRVFGINAWETRGEEREKGLIAKREAKEILPEGKKIVVHTLGDDKGKYGRYLAIIYVDGEQFNSWVVEQGHGKYQEY